MTTKQGIIKEIQTLADATNDNQTRISFGAPGQHLKNVIDELKPTGLVWDESERVGTWPLIIEGFAAYLNKVRRVTESTDLLSTDRVIEMAANSIVVTLPDASEDYRGQYIIKAVNTSATLVSGTIDGVSGTVPVVAFEVLRVYCNGAEWLTW